MIISWLYYIACPEFQFWKALICWSAHHKVQLHVNYGWYFCLFCSLNVTCHLLQKLYLRYLLFGSSTHKTLSTEFGTSISDSLRCTVSPYHLKPEYLSCLFFFKVGSQPLSSEQFHCDLYFAYLLSIFSWLWTSWEVGVCVWSVTLSPQSHVCLLNEWIDFSDTSLIFVYPW